MFAGGNRSIVAAISFIVLAFAANSACSSATPPPTPTTASPYTATYEQVQRDDYLVRVDVNLPQVQGGTENVAQTFNTSMQAALKSQILESPVNSTLKGRSQSGVRTGKRVLSGLLLTGLTPLGASGSIARARTVVVDTDSGSLMTLSSLFDDMVAGLRRLQTESQKLGLTSTAGSTFSGSNLQADETTFSHWTAETSGMRVYFDEGTVAPASRGVVELTIPWADLNDLLKPGVSDITSS